MNRGLTSVISSFDSSLFSSHDFPDGTGMKQNNVTRNTHPVTSPMASGLRNKKKTLRVSNHRKGCTHILGFDPLLRSWPNKFALINKWLRLGISLLVSKNAHADNAAFTINGCTIIFVRLVKMIYYKCLHLKILSMIRLLSRCFSIDYMYECVNY